MELHVGTKTDTCTSKCVCVSVRFKQLNIYQYIVLSIKNNV